MDFNNRVAVIAGATGGLGRIVAREFSGLGAKLALFGSKFDNLEKLSQELNLDDDRIILQAIDMADPSATQAAGLAVYEKFNHIDIVLHLVGGWTGGKNVIDVQAGALASMLNQHAWTTLYAAQTFIPYMIANQWGRFIAISSPSARQPAVRGAPFAMGKAAQEALVLALSEELKGTGVTANILLVRRIDLKNERDQQPTSRNSTWTTPEEIFHAIKFLCTDEARVINGARLPLYIAN